MANGRVRSPDGWLSFTGTLNTEHWIRTPRFIHQFVNADSFRFPFENAHFYSNRILKGNIHCAISHNCVNEGAERIGIRSLTFSFTLDFMILAQSIRDIRLVNVKLILVWNLMELNGMRDGFCWTDPIIIIKYVPQEDLLLLSVLRISFGWDMVMMF